MKIKVPEALKFIKCKNDIVRFSILTLITFVISLLLPILSIINANAYMIMSSIAGISLTISLIVLYFVLSVFPLGYYVDIIRNNIEGRTELPSWWGNFKNIIKGGFFVGLFSLIASAVVILLFGAFYWCFQFFYLKISGTNAPDFGWILNYVFVVVDLMMFMTFAVAYADTHSIKGTLNLLKINKSISKYFGIFFAVMAIKIVAEICGSFSTIILNYFNFPWVIAVYFLTLAIVDSVINVILLKVLAFAHKKVKYAE